MKTGTWLLAGALVILSAGAHAAGPRTSGELPRQPPPARPTEAGRKLEAGRILLKWGGYVEKVEGRDRKAWAAALWPSLASADLDNLRRASRAVTYEGMRNALLGQRPYDDEVVDRMARSRELAVKSLGNAGADLVFTPVTPCRIVDTRVLNDRIGAGAIRALDASNVGGDFSLQGGSDTNCGIPANPAALALSVTGVNNAATGYLRVFPFDGTSAQGSPVPLSAVNTTATNDIIVPACQGCAQELKVFSTTTAHYAAFVTGYFMAPVATALECTRSGTTRVIVAANSSRDGTAPACPATYTATGTDCLAGSFTDTIVGIENGKCYMRSGAFESDFYISRTCCRIPGR